MEHREHLAHLRREADAYAAALAGADLAAPVAACPGWDVAALTGHLGEVHRWATLALATPAGGEPPSYDGSPEGDQMTPPAWFEAGAAALVDALAAGAADQPCWTMADPRTARFWSRRQAHETAVHRWDLEDAVGDPSPIDPDLAADGIDEVLDTMLPRQVRLGRVPATGDWLRLVAGGRELVLGTSERRDPEPVGTVAGTAEQVLLLLWGRADAAGLDGEGDRQAVSAFLARRHVP